MLGSTIRVAEDRVRTNKRKRFPVQRQLRPFPDEGPPEHHDATTKSVQPPLPVPEPRGVLPNHRSAVPRESG